jgi:hypothetical protein
MNQHFLRENHSAKFASVLIPLFTVLCLLPAIAFGQKTDVITFKNGDKLTVDIKQFERGILRASTVGMGTIQIQWDVIESIETDKTYEIELSSGSLYLGSVSPADDGTRLSVWTATGPTEVELADVTTISRIKREQSIWSRIDGSVQFGLNYTSGSQVGQTNVGLTAWFQEARYIVGTEFNATLTTGSAERDTRRMKRKIGRLPGLIYRESSSARPFVASEIVAACR